MDNKRYLVCNFKSVLQKDDFINYIDKLKTLNKNDKVEMILCPPSTYLYLFSDISFKLGSQEISKYGNGPYTGETTGEQLSSLGVSYALIAHSESREILKDDNESIIKRIINSYDNKIRPIYFIGETKMMRDLNKKEEVLKKQLMEIINGLNSHIVQNMLIVYEPVWSIGTDQIPSIQELNDTLNYINRIIQENYNVTIPVLYGGSVSTKNVEMIANVNNLCGLVLGDSATDFDALEEIYNKYQKFK